MPTAAPDERWEDVQRHRSGSVKARGPRVGDVLDGYWEWFREDGTLKRSGSFDLGRQTGEWTTYDAQGLPYKVTTFE